jgi:hypothetical protein
MGGGRPLCACAEKLRRKIAPKNSPETKKNGTGAPAENGKRKLPSLENKKIHHPHLLPTNFFEPSRAAAEKFQKTPA